MAVKQNYGNKKQKQTINVELTSSYTVTILLWSLHIRLLLFLS